MHPLRKEWQQWLLENHIPARLARHVAEHKEAPLFTEAETAWLRESFRRFSSSLSPASDWDFEVAEGQPHCLSALERLSTIMGDRDTALFPRFKAGGAHWFWRRYFLAVTHFARVRMQNQTQATTCLGPSLI